MSILRAGEPKEICDKKPMSAAAGGAGVQVKGALPQTMAVK